MRFGLISMAMAVAASAATGAAAAERKAPAPSPSGAPWAVRMRALEKTLQELLMDISSDARFNNPANAKRIEKNAEKFSRLAHSLKEPGPSAPIADPSIRIIADLFDSEANHAYKALAGGHRGYARGLLRSMTGYCMACHTRNSSGPSFEGVAEGGIEKSLKGLEKADFLASVRQFDRALEQYDAILADPAVAGKRPFDWERAVRSSLAISVRVKKDPERALSAVERVLRAPKAPVFLKEQATQWKASLEAWKKEPTATPQTEEGYYTQAVKLLADAKALQRYPADRSADVLYLRASSAVHDLMAFAPQGKRVGEALYLAGLSYEVLEDLYLWDVHEFYYLACIFKTPHSDVARSCYNHYEQSIYRGYTGTAGTSLPGDVVEKLHQLEVLSAPVEKTVPR